MPGYDETENEIRYRIQAPEKFDDFRTKEVTEGVVLLLGHDKETGAWEVTAVHFDNEKFTLDEAQTWIESHPDVEKMKSKHDPQKVRKLWKISSSISKLDGTLDSEHFYIYGDASVVLVDREGDKISEKALSYGLPMLLRRRMLSLEHTDILLGPILEELNYKGTTYKTQVKDGRLTLVGDILNDTKMCKRVRKGILDGEYNSFSISGESLESNVVCDKDGCWSEHVKTDLSAVAVCQEGMNQGAKFTVLKADDFAVAEKDASLDSIRGGMNTKKEGDTKKEASKTEEKHSSDEKTAPPNSSEQKQEEEAPAEEAPEEEAEASIQESLKAISSQLESQGQAIASLTSRVGAMESAKATEEEAPEEEAPAEEEKTAEEKSEPKKLEVESEEKKSEEAGSNASPVPMPKKSLAKGAGGSQFKPEGGETKTRAWWEQVGEKVAKSGGFNKPGSPMNEKRKR